MRVREHQRSSPRSCCSASADGAEDDDDDAGQARRGRRREGGRGSQQPVWRTVLRPTSPVGWGRGGWGVSSRARAPRALPCASRAVSALARVRLCVRVSTRARGFAWQSPPHERAVCTRAHTNTAKTPRFPLPRPLPLPLSSLPPFQSPCVTLHRVHISISRRSSGRPPA